MALVSLTDVTKTYPDPSNRKKQIAAIDGVSLDIQAGEIYGIIGYSGAGKSTLVRLINALESATSGSILVDGAEVTTMREGQLRKLRLGVGMIFQQFNLFNSKSVRANIAYPLKVAGVPRAERIRRVNELLAFVGLTEKARSFPDQLSGGQKQRVGIARALATSPRILLADEATSALDPETTHEVLGLLKKVNQELGITIIVITHEMDVIQQIATRVAVMENGRVIEDGEVYSVFSNPQHAATRRFVSTVVRGIPAGDELAVLRQRHPGRIFTVSILDGDTGQSRVFEILTRAGLSFELIYGGINDIQGRTFGHLTIAVTGADAAIESAFAEISALTEIVEAR
ncbi:methionine ABC transporter ATP-binding protein [Mycetocola tolaasinivorans]|uniref:Methionine ABC transporter ATP-binding protein n=1 Tax=Mycetocola tolaasinivorans TaxID=76635 RepID=A0A3L7A0U6_9MICO|nr:methionine ABC transporter ATP-binding protein [Mycetocola tolaasinivorans]RLP73694.1 methionine ABC transporter ATP-binding protein [Mycetocola tolaasinivorans]